MSLIGLAVQLFTPFDKSRNEPKITHPITFQAVKHNETQYKATFSPNVLNNLKEDLFSGGGTNCSHNNE
jgi:hypothetical protein